MFPQPNNFQQGYMQQPMNFQMPMGYYQPQPNYGMAVAPQKYYPQTQQNSYQYPNNQTGEQNQQSYEPKINNQTQNSSPSDGNTNFNQYQSPLPQLSSINGKIVENEEMVKVTEVPLNSYGVFPQADMSSIYVKKWNPNGTTTIVTYKPYFAPQVSSEQYSGTMSNNNENYNVILDRISAIEEKINQLLSTPIDNKEMMISNNKEANF